MFGHVAQALGLQRYIKMVPIDNTYTYTDAAGTNERPNTTGTLGITCQGEEDPEPRQCTADEITARFGDNTISATVLRQNDGTIIVITHL